MAPQQALRPERTVDHIVSPAPAQPAVADAAALPRDQASPGRGRSVVVRVLRWILLVIAVGLLARFVKHGWPDVRESLSLLGARHAPFVGLALAVEAGWVFAMSQVYRSALMAFGGAVSRKAALRISMAAFTLSRILPGGGAAGGAVAARELIALGNPAPRTIVSMLASWWITMTGLSALVVSGVAISVAAGTLSRAYLAAPSAALGAFVLSGAAIVVAARRPWLRTRLSAVIARGASRVGPAIATGATRNSLDDVGRSIRIVGVLAVFAWGLAVWTLDAAALWFSLAAFGVRVDIGVLLVGYGVANLISALPELTPGWLGVLEASVAVTLAAFGVPEGIAVVAVLIYRLVSYWLPTIAGIPAAFGVLGRGRRSPKTVARRRLESPRQVLS